LFSAKDLVCGLLCVAPDQRVTAAGALAHPWIQVRVSHHSHYIYELTRSLQMIRYVTIGLSIVSINFSSSLFPKTVDVDFELCSSEQINGCNALKRAEGSG
jgi:serine/threonine protein kinase